jgi:hypothetical protein
LLTLPSVKPEVPLLCRCLTSASDAVAAAAIGPCLSAALDWNYMVRTARRHRVLALLHWNLRRSDPARVPRTTMEEMHAHSEVVQRRNRLLTDGLHRLLGLFASHGINAVPYKGPVLALSAYRNLDLREFRDLDVLIHKEDLSRTKDILASQGFVPEPDKTYRHESDQREFGYNLAFIAPRRAFTLEIHWAFTSEYLPFPVDLGYLSKRLEPFVLEGTPVKNIAPEELLLILCVHASKHCWDSLNMVADVAALMQGNPGLNWSRIVEQAATLGSTRMLLLGLLLASDLASAEVPPQYLEMARADRFAPSMANEVIESQFNEACTSPSALGFYMRLVF